MRATEILKELETLGAQVAVVDNGLRVEARRGAISDCLKDQLRTHKPEILQALGRTSARPLPARGAPDPSPPQPDGLALGRVRSGFAEHGVQPAWDDLIAAALLERQREWCEATLEAAYRGEMTLFCRADGRVSAAPRGEVC